MAYCCSQCTIAAGRGHLDCLKYIFESSKNDENKSVWNESIYIDTCICAAYGGHLDCLKYAHENGCPWDRDTCLYAVYNNQLECLKYACENGCPFHLRRIIKKAVQYNDYAIFIYLIGLNKKF